MPFQTTMQDGAAKARHRIAQAARSFVEWQQRLPLKPTTIVPSADVSTILLGVFGPVGTSVVFVRLRHFAPGLGFSPY